MVIGIIKFKKLSNHLRFIFLFVVFGCLTEVAMEVVKVFGIRNVSPVGNIYFPIAFSILGLFYFSLLKDYINRKIIAGVITTFILLCIVNLMFIQNLQEFPNFVAIVGSLIIIVFSVLQFSKTMAEAKIEKLSAEPIIWINTALLIYYSANFFYFIVFNLSLEFSREFARQIHNFYAGVNVLFYSLIAVGFWKAGKNKT